MNEYIDVRGVWPVYVTGFIAIELKDAPRNITVSEARQLILARQMTEINTSLLKVKDDGRN